MLSGSIVTTTGRRRGTFLPISGHRGDLLRGHVDLADSGVSEIGDIQIAMGVEGKCGRLAQDGSADLYVVGIESAPTLARPYREHAIAQLKDVGGEGSSNIKIAG